MPRPIQILEDEGYSRTNNVAESLNRQLNKNFQESQGWNLVVENLHRHKKNSAIEFFSHQPIRAFGARPKPAFKRPIRRYDSARLELIRSAVIEFESLP